MTGILNMLLGSAVRVFTPVTHTYSTAGTFTETIPSGSAHVEIECWGDTGAGGNSIGVDPTEAGGGGGGSGGYTHSSYPLVFANWGQTLAATIGAGGQTTNASGTGSSVSTGSFAITTMSSGGGGGGFTASSSSSPGAGGVGGSASGGNLANTSGNGGASGQGPPNETGGAGGAGISGVNGTGNPGGNGGGINGVRQLGKAGLAIFRYT